MKAEVFICKLVPRTVKEALHSWAHMRGEENSKGMECCPISNYVGYLEREK